MTAERLRLTAALADRYTIEHELGAGGMATVYLAHDIKHDRRVAVKVLRPELAAVIGAERFLVEIRTTANLQHPHILPLFDSGEADSFLFYVMPYVEGISLRDRLTREKQLPIHEAVRIASEVASALDYAHRHGVIHRDIKPENILLHDGSALVADFGIAIAASKAGTRMTETGMSLGTPQYMSPEQAMGERELDARSDVYALGCVTYEMLTGEPPFSGPTAQAIVAKVMTAEPAEISSLRRTVPANVADAVHTALQKLPADRFDTAAHFAEALSGQGSGAPSRARTGTLLHHYAIVPWRKRFQLACAAALVALALGAWGWLRSGSGPPQPIARQYIVLGDSVHMQTALRVGEPLALSPDGSKLAVIGDTLFRIWVKRRDALEAVPLQGTERASSATFSPDGQWIAYVAQTQLRKVRADGGVSITLSDSAGGGFGVVWLEDNTIIYTDVALLGLRRVSAGGGPSTVALADSTFHGAAPLEPTPLPHSRGVVFGICASNCVTRELHALDFATGRHPLLVHDVATGWYLPSGELLYVRRDGVAMVAPFDPGKMAITGTAIPILQGVAQTLFVPQLAWSKSGTLIYGLGTATGAILSLQWATQDGVPRTFDAAWEGEFNSFDLSPDGRRVAVGVTTPGSGLDIWTKQLDNGPFTRLTFSGRDRRPAWSPDGREIAFVRDTVNGGDIWIRAADGGGGERRAVHLDRAVQEVAWSRNGRWLLVRTDDGARGNGDILAVSVTGDSTLPVATSNATEMQPAMSPDGRWVAYVSNETGIDEVDVRPFPDVNSGHWQVSNGGGGTPIWAPDGKRLYFLDAGNRLIAAELGTESTFSVTHLTPLFDATAFSYVGFHEAFTIDRNGRFVFLGPTGGTVAPQPRLVLVDNWFADLRAKLKP